MFKSTMNYIFAKFWIAIFICSCMHFAQCKYLHKRTDDFDNSVQGKPRQYLRDNTDLSNEKPSVANDDVANSPESGKDVEAEDPSLQNDTEGDITVKDDEVVDPPEPDVATDDAAVDGEQEQDGDDEKYDENDPVQVQDDEKENLPNSENDDVEKPINTNSRPAEPAEDDNDKKPNCWFPIRAQEHFKEMNDLDRKFEAVRKDQGAIGTKEFDKTMLEALLKTRSIAERALQNFGGDPNLIPAGLNLGGYCMMRMPQSVLFFHRLKLRNNTRFRVNYLHNDMQEMILTARLSLNDLHLLGDYERAVTHDSPSTLYYTPTYGDLEFLLKDVEYKVEGRYRLLNDKLYVEHIISELQPKAILMRYMKDNNTASTATIRLEEHNIGQYLHRMKNDLDHWLKDYFNDFLIYFNLPETRTDAQNQLYQNEKIIVRNHFADKVVKQIRKRLRAVNASNIMIPSFTIFTVNELEIKLYDGVIRGLDTVNRRSVATGKLDKDNVRYVDTIIEFSSLKVEYKYEMWLGTGLPALFGSLVLNADQLTARLALKVVSDSPSLDMHFALLPPISEAWTLVVEGPANRYIAKYKHILEHQIESIMISTMVHYMQQLDSLARCQPLLIGKDDPNYKNIDETDSEETETTQVDKEPTDDDSNVTDPESEDNSHTDAPDDNPYTDAPDVSDQKPDKPDNLPSPDYEVSKVESIELEFPPKTGAEKGEKMLLKVDEKFSLTRLNKTARKTG